MSENLEQLRAAIAAEDAEIVAHLARRLHLVLKVADLKGSQAIPIMQPGQVANVLTRVGALAYASGLRAAFVRGIYESIIAEACRLEEEQIRAGRGTGRRAVILGGGGVAGGIGRALFELVGYDCVLVDIDSGSGADLVADVCNRNEPLESILHSADVVVLATPHDVTVNALRSWIADLCAETLVVDLLSSKSAMAEVVESLGSQQEVMGLNPMYGAGLRPLQPSMLCVIYQGRLRAPELVRALREAGGELVECADARQHDLLCTRWQALVHATVLAFGHAATELGEDFVVSGRRAPPPFRLIRSLLGRMLSSGDGATYEEIQFAGPDAASARRALAAAANLFADGDRQVWRATWADLLRAIPQSELAEGEDQFLRASRAILERFPTH